MNIFRSASLLIAASAQWSSAAPLTVLFTGQIDDAIDAEHLLDPSIMTGTPFSGWYSFEPSAGDTNPGADYGYYLFNSQLSVQIAGTVLTTTDLYIEVFDNTNAFPSGPFDAYTAGGVETTGSAGLPVGALGISFRDDSMTAFSSDSLPTSLAVTSFNSNEFLFVGYHNDVSLSGHIDSLQIVPEPSAFLILLCAAVLVTQPRPGLETGTA